VHEPTSRDAVAVHDFAVAHAQSGLAKWLGIVGRPVARKWLMQWRKSMDQKSAFGRIAKTDPAFFSRADSLC
jgi:hypothetical protein